MLFYLDVKRAAVWPFALAVLATQCISVGLYAHDTTNWTAAEDHQNMMDQLGIKALRPGLSGNENAPNHANYDEAKANAYPDLPDPPEIIEDFEREVVGRVPQNVPSVAWKVTKTVETEAGSHRVAGSQLIGHVDNSSYPGIEVDIETTLVLPADTKSPIAVMILLRGRTIPQIAFPVPALPGAHELLSLCAPRPTFISYGVPEKGDAKWLDQQGSFMAAVAAQPLFRLLGAKGLGVPDDYHTGKMPPVNVGLVTGQLAWRLHDGGHTDGPNWKYFIPWADQFLHRGGKGR